MALNYFGQAFRLAFEISPDIARRWHRRFYSGRYDAHRCIH